MKLSSGRGIQFFKKPIFSAPKSFVVNTFSKGKQQLATAFSNLNKKTGKNTAKVERRKK